MIKGSEAQNKGHANFYECCDLTEKVYLMYMYPLKKPACWKKLRLKKAQALLSQTFMKSLSFLHHVEKLELNVVSLTSILRTITSAFLNTKKIANKKKRIFQCRKLLYSFHLSALQNFCQRVYYGGINQVTQASFISLAILLQVKRPVRVHHHFHM